MSQSHHMKHPIKRSDLIHYGFLAMSLAFAGIPLYIHAPDYYATQYGLSLSSIGFMLLFLRCFDAVQDPLIGKISDRFSARRPEMIIVSALLLVVSFTALFYPLAYPLLWFALSMLLATTAFSVLSINLNTIGGLWSRDPHQKTRIAGVREALGLIGLLLAVLLPSLLQQGMKASEAFLLVSAVLAVFTMAAIVLFTRWWRTHAQHILKTHDANMQHSIFQTLKHLPHHQRNFFTIYFISILASSIPAVLVLFFIRDRLALEAYTGLFLALYFLSGAAAMPFWQKMSRKHGKHHAWLVAMLTAVASFVWAFFLAQGDVWQYAIICIASGVALSADLSLPPSILADHIQQGKNEHAASLQFGLFAFLAKAALALAGAIAFPMLDLAGFSGGQHNTANALFALSLTYALIPCAIKLCAVGLLYKTITRQENNHIKQPDHFTDRSSHA